MQRFMSTTFFFISWSIGMCLSGAVVEVGRISFEIWASKVCNKTVADTWVTNKLFNCYCRKYSFGFIIRLSKYRLERCEKIPKPVTSLGTTSMPTSMTTTQIHPPPNFCPNAIAFGGLNYNIADEVQLWENGNSSIPTWSVSIGYERFEGVDLRGTFRADPDVVSRVVFSFIRGDAFYLFSWKRERQVEPGLGVAEAGFTIQLVNSLDGLGGKSDALKRVLWTKMNVTGQATTLFWNNTVWEEKILYTWFIMHRPAIGLIRVKIYAPNYKLLIDSGVIFDQTHKGGRVGPYTHFQAASFDNFIFRCSSGVPISVYKKLSPLQKLQTHIEDGSEETFIDGQGLSLSSL